MPSVKLLVISGRGKKRGEVKMVAWKEERKI